MAEDLCSSDGEFEIDDQPTEALGRRRPANDMKKSLKTWRVDVDHTRDQQRGPNSSQNVFASKYLFEWT